MRVSFQGLLKDLEGLLKPVDTVHSLLRTPSEGDWSAALIASRRFMLDDPTGLGAPDREICNRLIIFIFKSKLIQFFTSPSCLLLASYILYYH